jgi:hypothetical protein
MVAAPRMSPRSDCSKSAGHAKALTATQPADFSSAGDRDGLIAETISAIKQARGRRSANDRPS